MTEQKGNKIQKESADQPIKLPSELREALRKEVAEFLARGEKAPSFGSILSEAWHIREASRRGAPLVAEKGTSESTKSIQVPVEDVDFIMGLLAIIHDPALSSFARTIRGIVEDETKR